MDRLKPHPLLSIVVPVYRGKGVLHTLAQRVHEAISGLDVEYELILVDDACPEGSWETIRKLSESQSHVKGLRLSRNFGQHNAITAGLEYAAGEWVVIMDCDLQDRPEEIPRLFAKVQEGYDLVRARRKVRMDGYFKRLSSKLFNRVFSYLTDTKKNHEIANFGIYHRQVIDSVLAMGDRIRFTPSLIEWVGFREAQIEVQHDIRAEGKSGYTWVKLISLALDNAVAFSLKPLHLTLRLGFILAFVAFAMTAYYAYQRVNGHIEIPGYASIIISIWLLSGVIVTVLGIIGLYVGYAFMNSKGGPHYIIAEIAEGNGTA